MNKAIYLGYILFMVALTSNVRAQQTPCDAVLFSNLADESTIVDKASARDTATYAACSMTYQEFGSSMGAGASGQYGLISGSGSYSESNYNNWKKTNCSSGTSDSNRYAYRFSAQKTFNSGIVDAWSKCMADLSGLNCWASPSNGNTIEANIRWKSDEDDLPVVVAAPLRGGSVSNTKANLLIDLKSRIPKGMVKILVDRTFPNSDIHAIINAQRGNIAYSCSIFAPAPKLISHPQLISHPPECDRPLRASDPDFDGDKCADSYRIEAGRMMVRLSNNGRYVQVPSNIPDYNAELGFWLSGDFDGDELTDLIHMVTKDTSGGSLDYNHVHFADGNGGFRQPTKFSFPCAANPQCDYNTSLGYWTTRGIDSDRKTDLEHNPQISDNRKHCWFSLGNGRFQLRACPSL